MLMQTIKEEPVDDLGVVVAKELHEDEIASTFDIVTASNVKFKTFVISGLANILDRSKQYDVSIRTDLKEMKISSKLNENCVFYTKQTNANLDKRFYSVKFSKETGCAYFIPIDSFHSVAFLDEANRSMKSIDSQNLIFEDCFKMPHPSRNKHDQLCIEMKNYLYKPLKCVLNPDHVKRFLAELYTSTGKRISHLSENRNKNSEPQTGDPVDLANCPHWHLIMVNLYDIRKIDILDLKVEVFLRKAQVLRFVEIEQILDDDRSKLLSVLQTVGHLIKGNWVIKSNLLYKFSALHDSEARQNHYKDLIAAREHLLFLIATNRAITFADIYSKFKKSPDHEEILNRLTIRSGLNEPIRFVMAEDGDFLAQYTNIAHKQNQKTLALLSKHQTYTGVT